MAVLAVVVHESPRREPVRGGYRVMLRDRALAELAPAHLRGRYMAVVGLCFWIGLAAAPTGGTALLSLSPTAAFGVAAGVALAAAVSMLRLERRLPEAARLTPRPRREPRPGRAASLRPRPRR